MRQNTDNVQKRRDANVNFAETLAVRQGEKKRGMSTLSLISHKLQALPTCPPPPAPVHRNRSDLAHLIKHAHI